MLSHVTFGSNDIQRSGAFYNEVLGLLGIVRLESYDDALGYARRRDGAPWLWILRPYDRLPATWGNGSHLALMAESREQVDLFHAAALAKGGRDEGAPSLREHYAPDYYAAYVRDPDGNKLQAVNYGEGRVMAKGQGAISHVTLGSNDLVRARGFYDSLLATLGIEQLYVEPEGAAYCLPGTQKPAFSIRRPFDGRPATWGNGTHVAFLARSRALVDGFHAKALAKGGKDEGAPGPRPHYGPTYYGAYLRDLDGNKLQAVCYAPA